MGKFAVEHMEIGAADRASRDAHEQLIRSQHGPRHFPGDERLARRFENHRAHDHQSVPPLVPAASLTHALRCPDRAKIGDRKRRKKRVIFRNCWGAPIRF